MDRRIEQQDQSAQTPLLWDHQSDQPLSPHLVGSERLRSFCALMTRDVGGLHGNSRRTIFIFQYQWGRRFGSRVDTHSFPVDDEPQLTISENNVIPGYRIEAD